MMAGLNLGLSGSFGGVSSTPPASYGNANSYDSITSAAFGPGVSVPAESTADTLHPGKPFGMSLWIGVASIAALVLIRSSLPN